jgi:hypothetical protein
MTRVRKAIELHAMDRAIRVYEEHGYTVVDVSGRRMVAGGT